MNNNLINNHLINYEIFNTLLSSYKWVISKKMKECWTPKRHLDYIDSIYHYYPNGIKFYINSNSTSFNNVQKIDVFIMPTEQVSETSSTKHIQFIKKTKQ